MPVLDGKRYSYDKEGYKKYMEALKKKRKKKSKKEIKTYEYGDQEGAE
mgnify:CR=1 FL=1